MFTKINYLSQRIDGKLRKVTKEAMAEIFINRKIVVKSDSRCCIEHYKNPKYLTEEAINSISVFKKSTVLNKTEIEILLGSFITRVSDYKDLFARFKDISNLDDEFSFRFTGFYLEELHFILIKLTSLNNSPVRSRCQALAI